MKVSLTQASRIAIVAFTVPCSLVAQDAHMEEVEEEHPAPPPPHSTLHNNFGLIMKQKSEEPHQLRRCLTLSDKSESEEAYDIVGDIGYDRIKPAKRSRTKWIAAAVSCQK